MIDECYDCKGRKLVFPFGIKDLCVRCINVRTRQALNEGLVAKNKMYLDTRNTMGGNE